MKSSVAYTDSDRFKSVHWLTSLSLPNTDQRTGTVFLRIWMLTWTTLPGEPERNSLVLKCDVSATGKKAHLYLHTDKHGAKICGSEALRAGLKRVYIKVSAAVMERQVWRDWIHICSEAPFSMFFKKVEVNRVLVFSSSDRAGASQN